ncbi:MAG: hypothetical protein WD470_00065, partial [Rhodospirillaceae bacterium]
MRMKTRFAVRSAAILVVAAAVGSGPAAAEVTLSALSFLPNHTANGKPFADWVEKINGEAKGT